VQIPAQEHIHSKPAGYQQQQQQQQQQQGGYPAHSAQTNPDVPAALSPRKSLVQSHTGTTPQRGSTLANLKTAAIGIHGVGETLRGTLNSTVDHRMPGNAPEATHAKNQAVLDAGRSEIETGRYVHSNRPMQGQPQYGSAQAQLQYGNAQAQPQYGNSTTVSSDRTGTAQGRTGGRLGSLVHKVSEKGLNSMSGGAGGGSLAKQKGERSPGGRLRIVNE